MFCASRTGSLLLIVLSVFATELVARGPADIDGLGGNRLTVQAVVVNSSSSNVHSLEIRQNSCPNPSTEEYCETGYCFLVQARGSAGWGSCCPSQWSLILYSGGSDGWTTQKCCPPGVTTEQCKNDGISEPPLQPLQCGGGAILSGWACVYGTPNVSPGQQRWSAPLVAMLGIVWVGFLACLL